MIPITGDTACSFGGLPTFKIGESSRKRKFILIFLTIGKKLPIVPLTINQ
ncbi:MAG: hypothetical protein GXY48_11750 [Methanomicrobiales archaeon]|nr:hypothetical protein [Methanomicrobiales archaeon]